VSDLGLEPEPEYGTRSRSRNLKGLSHEIFGLVFWAVWIYLGLNVNRLWFLNLNDAPLILDTYFKL
jgi:hypothetical protein